MKKLLSLLLLLTSLTTFAQNNSPKIGSISGIISDVTTKEPIPYATVSIHNEKDELITGGISNDQGAFDIKKIPLGSFTVKVQFIGYEDLQRNISITRENKSQNLGNITLKEGSEQLDAVEVIAERSTIEQKIDRKVINVGKDLISAGATATEIMNNIQSVSVDQQTGAIALRGNENVRVLVDGKPTNIDPSQLLQQIPSASIKQIELITNPSAKYNPEGMSGIINIVLHKNSNMGFNGNINTGVTFAITPKFNSSLGLNYREGKINVYGNYGLNTGKQQNEGFINSFEENLFNRQDFDFGNDNTSHLIKAGVDYYINDKNTLSFYTTQNIFDGDGFGKTVVDFLTNNTNDVIQNFDNSNKSTSQTYNLDYKIDFNKEGHNLELEVNYNTTDAPEKAIFDLNYPNSINWNYLRTDGVSNNRDNTIINLDYINPLSESSKLEMGLETRIQTTENGLTSVNQTSSGYSIDNSNFKYDRNIYSAYATYSKQWEKWSAQVGARLEQYTVDANFSGYDVSLQAPVDVKFEDDIFTVYPSAFITYAPNEKNSFNFSYSRRVDRPGIGQVNPIREWSTPQIDSKGNPNLEPQFTNSFEVNYTKKMKIGSVTLGTFYRRINDEITRIVNEHPTDNTKNILSYENFEDNDAFGVEASANLRFTKWWSTNASIDIYSKTVKGTLENSDEPSGFENVSADVTTFNTRVSNNFKASKKLRFQLFGFYRGRDLGLQFERTPMWKIDAGASYNVFKNKGTLSVRVSDIFDSMNFGFDGSKPYPQDGEFNWESQSVYLGFNYRFGGGKNRALQRKQRDSNETQGSGGMM